MKSYVVGIDIGGTNTKLGIVDSRGTVLAKDSIKTTNINVSKIISKICIRLLRL